MWWMFTLALAGRVDRVIAVLDDEVVLESDVRLAAELADHDRSPVPSFWAIRGTQGALDVALLDLAAGDIGLYRPSEAAVRSRLEALRDGFGDREAWRAFLARWGFVEADLLGVLRRRMRVEAYLLRNLRVPPSDPAAFDRATQTLLAELRPRVRVRRVEDP